MSAKGRHLGQYQAGTSVLMFFQSPDLFDAIAEIVIGLQIEPQLRRGIEWISPVMRTGLLVVARRGVLIVADQFFAVSVARGDGPSSKVSQEARKREGYSTKRGKD